MLDETHRKPQKFVHRPHPVTVALGQIIVHRDDMHTLPRQGVEVGRHGGYQCLSLSGLHLGNFPLMENYRPDNLHIKMAHSDGTVRYLPYHRKGFGENIIERGPIRKPRFEFCGFSTQLGIAEAMDFFLQRVDRLHELLLELPDQAILRPLLKNFFYQTKHFAPPSGKATQNKSEKIISHWNFETKPTQQSRCSLQFALHLSWEDRGTEKFTFPASCAPQAPSHFSAPRTTRLKALAPYFRNPDTGEKQGERTHRCVAFL